MSSFKHQALARLSGSRLARLGIEALFTIPSGIVTTVPSVIARIARDVPQIGFLTTKTISIEPRTGYREPILHEYYPGCFVNAVGLANPGAHAFVASMKRFLPLHDGKPLLVSIMGKDTEEFVSCARVLDEVADAFELNLSCPHVKGAGQAVGSDPESVKSIISALRELTDKPIVPKLSPNLGNIQGMARLCRDAGADGLTLINTAGPGVATDDDGAPVLSNVAGGLSGSGILPLGLKAVRDAAEAVDLPIIACGGISTAEHVRAYFQAGACLFGVGSSLAGSATPEIAASFDDLANGLEGRARLNAAQPIARTRARYIRSTVTANEALSQGFFYLRLSDGPEATPGGFFFLRIPGVGEKPFSPAWSNPPAYLVRSVGPFTRALEGLKPGDTIYMRGPYGIGFPEPAPDAGLALIGGGSGIAPIMFAARTWSSHVSRLFFGFSYGPDGWFHEELTSTCPGCRIHVDPQGSPGEVIRALREDVEKSPELYRNLKAYICGPAPMMKAATDILKGVLPAQAIFTAREDIMRCGIGVCGSCGTPGGHRSCVDGPVMTPETDAS